MFANVWMIYTFLREFPGHVKNYLLKSESEKRTSIANSIFPYKQ